MLINALSNWIQRKVICPHFCPHAPVPKLRSTLGAARSTWMGRRSMRAASRSHCRCPTPDFSPEDPSSASRLLFGTWILFSIRGRTHQLLSPKDPIFLPDSRGHAALSPLLRPQLCPVRIVLPCNPTRTMDPSTTCPARLPCDVGLRITRARVISE